MSQDLCELWEGIKPSSDDLLKYFDKPIQLKIYFNSLNINHVWFQASNDCAFTITTPDVDFHKGIEKEFGDKIKTGSSEPARKKRNPPGRPKEKCRKPLEKRIAVSSTL